jgi:hypothetical protein
LRATFTRSYRSLIGWPLISRPFYFVTDTVLGVPIGHFKRKRCRYADPKAHEPMVKCASGRLLVNGEDGKTTGGASADKLAGTGVRGDRREFTRAPDD